MIKASRELIENYDKYFLRKYQWRYHILIVDNHFYDCYSFFLQAGRSTDKLVHSYDLLEIPRDKALYDQVMKDFRQHSQMTIEYRDTHHLVHPGKDVHVDLGHGHNKRTAYKPK